MSTFAGRISELPGISIDRFDGPNLHSEAFFLSHCHTDHMRGLDNLEFQYKIRQCEQFLYLSPVSAEIIRRMYPNLKENLRELDPSLPTSVQLQGQTISVTSVPAGHCPGSIMFLFEAQKTILYTGDFRINPNDLPKFTAFMSPFNTVKKIDKVHLDTTFFKKSHLSFPSRSDSLKEICRIIQNWIESDKNHIIHLKTCAKYGYEYLFKEISNNFKMPIHVNDEVFDFYRKIPEMDTTVTRWGENTQIHSACGLHYLNICRNSSRNVQVINITAWRWNRDSLQDGISNFKNGVQNVCYSTHASYDEGLALLKFLKPKEVEASVLNAADSDEIMRNINEYLQEFAGKEEKTVIEKPQEAQQFTCNNSDNSSEESAGLEPEFCDILKTPPRKKKSK